MGKKRIQQKVLQRENQTITAYREKGKKTQSQIMKKSILIMLLLTVSFTAIAQNQERTTLSIISAPGAYEDGFNFGARFNYEHNWGYVGIEYFSFPKLDHTGTNEMSYNHILARTGLKHRFSIFSPLEKEVMLYSGARIGFIKRENESHIYQVLGLEAGFTYTIPTTNIFIGAGITSDLKNDSAIWQEANHTVNSVFLELGFNF